jgi:histidine triad (HIT) family protein
VTTSCSSIGRVAATATTTPRGSCHPRRPSASCSESAARASRRRGSSLPEDCLFCKLYREGDHVAATDGFVAIRDINPQAPIHLLVIPEHHIDSFREIAEFSADEDKRMLEFIADVAAREGLTDYRVAVNVGPTAGQTVFHLHWHIKGGWA